MSESGTPRARRPAMQRFELTFSTCPVPLLLISADGRICKTNERLDALFAYPPGELIGRSVDILVPSAVRPDHARMREAYCAAPSKRAMGAGRDLHGITRTGRTLPLAAVSGAGAPSRDRSRAWVRRRGVRLGPPARTQGSSGAAHL